MRQMPPNSIQLLLNRREVQSKIKFEGRNTIKVKSESSDNKTGTYQCAKISIVKKKIITCGVRG